MKIPVKIVSAILFVIYILILLRVTLFRTSIILFDIKFSETKAYFTSFSTAISKANFVPLNSICYYLVSIQEPIEVGIINVFGNILIFVPFGIFIPLIWEKLRITKTPIFIILFISLFFELSQLLMAIGYFDIDDILLNTLGGFIGYKLLKIWVKLEVKKEIKYMFYKLSS